MEVRRGIALITACGQLKRTQRSKASSSMSTSRPKRSSTNLSNLRLAPLSSKYVESGNSRTDALSQRNENDFLRNHPSYLQGKSAPSTPGILSRSSSRRRLHGMSRRSSIYDNDTIEPINYEYVCTEHVGNLGAQTTSKPMPKAKSEAALTVQRNRLARKGTRSPDEERKRYRSRTSTGTGGSVTPKGIMGSRYADDNWIMRTGMTTNAIVQESKGQSWMSSRPSSTSFQHTQDFTDGEDDEGYEEMAAMSTKTSRSQEAGNQRSAANLRSSGWGSRYGSRAGSRRTSRRGSFVGLQTPVALTRDGSVEDYDSEDGTSAVEPDFVDSEEDLDGQDEDAIKRIVDGNTFGLGGFVDRIMNFNLFKVEEKEENTDDEQRRKSEIGLQGQGLQTHRVETRGRPQEERLEAPQASGGWSDAAWLASVAAKAMF